MTWANRAAGDIPSMRMPGPIRAALLAAAGDTAALRTGTGLVAQARAGRGLRRVGAGPGRRACPPGGAARPLEHLHRGRRRIRPRASKSSGRAPAATPTPDPARMPGGQPGHLLGHQGGGPEREQQWAGGGPSVGGRVQDEAGHLQRVGQVAGEPTVVLTGHDAHEPCLDGQDCLAAQLVHHGGRFQIVVGIEAKRHPSGGKR